MSEVEERRLYRCNHCKEEKITENVLISGINCGCGLGKYDFIKILNIKEYIGCSNCIHVSTPKGKQCYTMSRRLKEMISNKGRIFSPEHVIPALLEIEKRCPRYKKVPQNE